MRLFGLAMLGRLLLPLLLAANIVGLARIIAGKLPLGRLVDVSELASSLVFLLVLTDNTFLLGFTYLTPVSLIPHHLASLWISFVPWAV